MKTFAALIRRYVLATAAIVLLVGGLLVGQFLCGVQVQRGGCNRLPGRRLG